MKPLDKNKTLSGEEIFKIIDSNDPEKFSALDDFEREAAEGLKLVKDRDRLKKIHDRIDEELKEKKKRRGVIFWLSAAASLVIVVGLIYLIMPKLKNNTEEVAAADITKTEVNDPKVTSDEKIDVTGETKTLNVTTDSVSSVLRFEAEKNNVTLEEKKVEISRELNNNSPVANNLKDEEYHLKSNEQQELVVLDALAKQEKEKDLEKTVATKSIADKLVKNDEDRSNVTYKTDDNQSNRIADIKGEGNDGVDKWTDGKKEDKKKETQDDIAKNNQLKPTFVSPSMNATSNQSSTQNSYITTNTGTGNAITTTNGTISNGNADYNYFPKKDLITKNTRAATDSTTSNGNMGLAGGNNNYSPYLQQPDSKSTQNESVTLYDSRKKADENPGKSNVTVTNNNTAGFQSALAENKTSAKNSEEASKGKDKKSKQGGKEQAETEKKETLAFNQQKTNPVKAGKLNNDEAEPVGRADSSKVVAPLIFGEIVLNGDVKAAEIAAGDFERDMDFKNSAVPQFPGGFAAMQKYFRDNVKMPADKKITGKVDVSFAIGKDGSVSGIMILKSIPGCDECTKEVIRVVKSMPKWKPGTSSGKPIEMRYHLPVRF